MRRIVTVIFVLNIVSALLFINFVSRPVYDDAYNIVDVHNYAANGVSVDSLLAQKRPPGPTAFIWMAAGVRLLRGDELKDARIAALASWILLVLAVLVGAKLSRCQELWYSALVTLLVFPHAVMTTATVLTEGPALLFAALGALAWLAFASAGDSLALGIFGGLSMGIAVTCRQYYLALLLAAGGFAFLHWKKQPSKENLELLKKVLLSLVVACLPVIVVVLIWHGISCPNSASASSSNNVWKATIGLNITRPLVAAFYVAVYFVPFTFPAIFRVKQAQRRIVLLIAVVAGIVISHFSSLLLQPGPLKSVVGIASRLHSTAGKVLFAIICIVTIYNAAATYLLAWDLRETLFQCAPAVFSLLLVAFFVAEQIGVGGNLPFYDRYALQVAPFMGLIAFALLPQLTAARMVVLGSLSVFSHFMLWRYAFPR